MVSIGKYSINDFPSVKFDGAYRVLACIPSSEGSSAKFPKFANKSFSAIDPSQWQEIDYEWYKNPILDQGMTSSCTGHGCCAGMQLSYMQSGRTLQEFNPYFIYGLVNGGRDAGAMISDCLTALMQYGVCPKNDLQQNMMFKEQFPQQAFDDAKRFKLTEAYKCDTFEEICAAITLGFVCPLGIMVGDNFPNLDSQGVAPLPAGGGGGHCILGMGIKKSSRYGWLIKVQNSWGCYDKETEILTTEGWKKFDKLEGHEEIATLNPSTHNLEYQNILENHVYDYDGDLLSHKSRDIDLLVTPNHRMYYKTNYNYKKLGNGVEGWEIKTADSLPENIHFKKNANWDGLEKEFYEIGTKKIPMDLWLEFMGYFISEGHTSSSKVKVKEWKGKRKVKIKGKQKRGIDGRFEFVDIEKDTIVIYDRIDSPRIKISYATGISQIKFNNIPKIQRCLDSLPFNFCKIKGGWTTNNKQLYMELRVFGKAHEKYIPKYIKLLTPRQIKIFYDAIMIGDGSESDCLTGIKRTYYTSSKILADDFQEILLKIGYAGDVSITDRIGRKSNLRGREFVTNYLEYRIGIKHKELEQRIVYSPEKVYYKDKVYCVTVPNGIVYIRRNGKAVWSGNSRFGMKGYCYIHKGHFRSMSPDAFAIQNVADSENEILPTVIN
jgi:hypothetical protein